MLGGGTTPPERAAAAPSKCVDGRPSQAWAMRARPQHPAPSFLRAPCTDRVWRLRVPAGAAAEQRIRRPGGPRRRERVRPAGAGGVLFCLPSGTGTGADVGHVRPASQGGRGAWHICVRGDQSAADAACPGTLRPALSPQGGYQAGGQQQGGYGQQMSPTYGGASAAAAPASYGAAQQAMGGGSTAYGQAAGAYGTGPGAQGGYAAQVCVGLWRDQLHAGAGRWVRRILSGSAGSVTQT